ncbi:MAG TPA: MOSC N-terminal beta barrel domain-containing protein [Gemmatimonadales bacterium]|nr:MOSC N-terminal beta barrel domain-containing protein [Gemmatimonadales bacterium]
MPSISLSSIHVYPVKACGGLSPTEWDVDDFGLSHDRRWMVTTLTGVFLTQREEPRLALIRPELTDDALVLRAPGMPVLSLPLVPAKPDRVRIEVWDDVTEGVPVAPEAAQWLSRYLGALVRLVWMPDDVRRPTDPMYAHGYRVSFADGFGFLLLSEASLEDLNRRLETPLPMNRFRPNLVVRGTQPFAEDGWRRFRVNGIELDVVKPCDRCVVTTTDQDTAERGKEPLRTLATFRRRDGKVLFGQNLVHRGTGRLAVGAPVEVLA